MGLAGVIHGKRVKTMLATGIPGASPRPDRASVGSVGDTYDNALAKTINGLYQAEVIHPRGP